MRPGAQCRVERLRSGLTRPRQTGVSVGVNPKAKRLARVLDRVIATRRAKVDHKDRTQSLD